MCVGLCLLTQSVLPHRALLGWCPSCWEQQPPCPFRRAPPPSSADRHTCSSLCSDNDDSEKSGMQHVWQWNPKQTAEYLTKYTLSSTVARGTYQLISCFFFPNATVIHEYDSQSLFLTQNNNRHNGRVFFYIWSTVIHHSWCTMCQECAILHFHCGTTLLKKQLWGNATLR